MYAGGRDGLKMGCRKEIRDGSREEVVAYWLTSPQQSCEGHFAKQFKGKAIAEEEGARRKWCDVKEFV